MVVLVAVVAPTRPLRCAAAVRAAAASPAVGAARVSSVAAAGAGAARHNSTLGDIVDARVAENPYRDCAVVQHQRIKWDFGDLKDQVDAVAAGLYEIGYGPGSRLALWLGNDSEHLVTTLAAAKLGVTIVSVDPDLSAADVGAVLSEESVRGLIFGQRYKGKARTQDVAGLVPELEQHQWGDTVKSKRLRSLRHLINTGSEQVDGIMHFNHFPVYNPMPDPLPRVRSVLNPADPFVVPYTAGATDGAPVRNAELSQKDLLDTAAAAAGAMKLTDQDTVVATADLSTRFGMGAGPLAALHAGARVVLPSREFGAAAALKAISTHVATAVTGDANGFAAMAAEAASNEGAYNLSSVSRGIAAGAKGVDAKLGSATVQAVDGDAVQAGKALA